MKMNFRSLFLISSMLFVLMLSIMSGSVSGQDGTVPVSAIPGGTIPNKQERILFIGDSLTAGLFSTHEQATFVSRLAEMTKQPIARRLASQLYIADHVWSEVRVWNPTIVVIEVGLNDINGGTYTNAQWKAQYVNLSANIMATGAKLIICTTFHFNNKPGDALYERRLQYNQMIRETAAETGATLADLWNATLNCPECVSSPDVVSYFGPYYHGDNFHPSDEGHRKIADEIYRVMFNRLYFPMVGN